LTQPAKDDQNTHEKSGGVRLGAIDRTTELACMGLALVIVGAFLWVPLGFTYILCMLPGLWREASWPMCITTMLLVGSISLCPCKPWAGLRRMRFWEVVVSYFEPEVWQTSTLPDSTKLFCFMPHGIFPFGQALGLVSWLNDSFQNMRPAVADVMVKTPGVGHFMTMLGCVSVSRKSMEAAIEREDNICLVPGGITEMFEASDQACQLLHLRSRKGFVRLALKHGIPLVPVYCFGNNETLHLCSISKHRVVRWLSRRLGVAFLLFWGRWFLPIPFRVPLRYAVGDAIIVPKLANATKEEVDQWHAKFVDATVSLYDQYKHKYYGLCPPLLKII